MYVIYKATSPSGKVYIGQTKNFETRKKWHLRMYNKNKTRFYCAIRKYGDTFQWEILEHNLTKEEANNKEIYYINLYNSTNADFGYNMTPGGQFCNSLAKESRDKWHKSFNEYLETNREKVVKNMQEITSRPEVKKKNSERVIKWFKDEINKEKHRNSLKKYFSKEENLIKASKSKGGKPFLCIETGEIFEVITLAAKKFNGDPKNLQAHLKNRKKSFNKFHFRYVE